VRQVVRVPPDALCNLYQTAERLTLLVTPSPTTNDYLSRAREVGAQRRVRVWHPGSTYCRRTRGASPRDLSHDVGEVMQPRLCQCLRRLVLLILLIFPEM
jgi:hypothetical protein